MIEYCFSGIRRRELRQAVKKAEPSIFDDLIRYLEDDLKTFGSGYVKEIIWKYITRYDLTSDDIARLERAALKYLQRPMSREFKLMCQTMARIATDEFWNSVKSELDSANPRVQLNASCLYPYSEGVNKGEQHRLEQKYTKHHYDRNSWVSPYHDAYKVDDLLAFVKDPANWPDGVVVYKEPNPADLPILHSWREHDGEVASLDIAAGHKKQILEVLDKVLSNSVMNVFTDSAWLYAIYLLQQIDDEGAVPILTKFLHDKLDYKVDGPRKGMLECVSLKVLRHYGTPKAMAVVADHAKADRLYSDYYRKINNGWLHSYPSIDGEITMTRYVVDEKTRRVR
jgi:hypothetical protein